MRVVRVLWERAVSLPLSGRRVSVMAYKLVDLKRTGSEADDRHERKRLLVQWERLINAACPPAAVGSKWRDV